MNKKKAVVKIFGIKDKPIDDNCCLNNEWCRPKTSFEFYKELKQFIEQSKIRNNVYFKFIDISKYQVIEYDYITKMMHQGFKMPFITINGKLSFVGKTSKNEIYKGIWNYLKNL